MLGHAGLTLGFAFFFLMLFCLFLNVVVSEHLVVVMLSVVGLALVVL